MVKPAYLIERDQDMIEKYGIDVSEGAKDIHIDLNMRVLVRVDDLYRDKTTFYKTLRKGIGSANPYSDCII